MQVKLTATYFLTTDHPKGKYDQPVLINRATGQAFLPYETFAAYESWPVMSATHVVSKMASWRDFSVEERGLIEQFLGIEHQDQLPGSKVRERSGTSRSVSSRGLSRYDEHLAFTRQRKRDSGSL
jgi:hypothetical protein